MEKEKNIAFIDGQNLHMGTRQFGWSVDYKKFRIYLKDKYGVEEAYYYLGFVSEDEQDLYDALQKAGFILKFKEHALALKGKKKGNVDTDVVFMIMKKIINKDLNGQVLLVSGDGDYKKVVSFLIEKGMFKKLLIPNREYTSSLFRHIESKGFVACLNDIRDKIIYKRKRPLRH